MITSYPITDTPYFQEIEEKYQDLEKQHPEEKQRIHAYKVQLLTFISKLQQDREPHEISRFIQSQFSSHTSQLEDLKNMRNESREAIEQSCLSREKLKSGLSIAGAGTGLAVSGYKMTERAAAQELFTSTIKHNLLKDSADFIAKDKSSDLTHIGQMIQEKLGPAEKRMLQAQANMSARVLSTSAQKAGRIALSAAAGGVAGGVVGAGIAVLITAATSDPLNEGEGIEK